jgi:seryl-tRNA synthetase
MLDINLIRKDPEKMATLLKSKDPNVDVHKIFTLDETLRALKTKTEQLKSTRNQLSKKIGEHKLLKEDTSDLMQQAEGFTDEIKNLDKQVFVLEAEFEKELSKLPNPPFSDIKVSQDPKENVVLKEWGEKPTFSFPYKNHVELNETLNLFDFPRAAKLSGTGWPLYKGMGARLEWALINYMLSIHIKNGFTQIIPPLLVKPEILFGSGQLPKFENQQYKLTDEDYKLYMIPTAEVPLNGMFLDEILKEKELPLKYVAYTPCFRREAGAAGSQERGLIRVHQFNKVEMFAFTKPEQGEKVFEEFIASAEEILQGLKLHYRNMLLVTGDMSFAASKTVDVEVWLPGQNRYYEVSSVSNCTDFQARRSKIRYRNEETQKPEFVYTLNGSGLATSRLMVAILENNQKEDGTVEIPEVLRPYLNGQSVLT